MIGSAAGRMACAIDADADDDAEALPGSALAFDQNAGALFRRPARRSFGHLKDSCGASARRRGDDGVTHRQGRDESEFGRRSGGDGSVSSKLA